MKRFAATVAVACLSGGLWGAGCGSTEGSPEPSGNAAAGGALALGGEGNEPGDSAGAGPTGVGGTGNTYTGGGCLNGATECTDCEDNDGDGLIDAFDPECSGPLDDDESSFATGIPGDNIDFCQDCFFDGNSGHGDDGCQYHTDCLYGENPQGASGCHNCDVTEECVNRCGGYTPNGCDCFGCCEVFAPNGESHTVLLQASCTLDKVADEEACPVCVQSDQCENDCKPCEICIGKPTPVGDDCVPDEPECPEERESCTEEMPCPDGYYCLTGCCVPHVVVK